MKQSNLVALVPVLPPVENMSSKTCHYNTGVEGPSVLFLTKEFLSICGTPQIPPSFRVPFLILNESFYPFQTSGNTRIKLRCPAPLRTL